MRAGYLTTVEKNPQGLTDFGFYTEHPREAENLFDLNQLVEEDRAYSVEVFRTGLGEVHIRLTSEEERIVAETEFNIRKESRGLKTFLEQTDKEPVMPRDHRKPDKAIEAYAEYALEHGKRYGIGMEDIDWDSLMRKENQGR